MARRKPADPSPAPSARKIRVSVANQQETLTLDPARLERAVQLVLAGEGVKRATISVAIVTDPAIHEVNRKFLSHDEPTDCISFVLEPGPDHLEGEVVASADTAQTQARRLGVLPADELLLYVIHGTLHLAGYDDLTDAAAKQMRERERHYLGQLGVTMPHWE